MSEPTEIAGVLAWEALDSRGSPTVGCEVRLAGGARGRVVVPSGASTGRHEAHELRDGDPARHGGRGVRRAVANVMGPLSVAVLGHDAAEQETVDAALLRADGSPGFVKLGANAVLAVSIGSALAAASALRMPLYEYLAQGGEPVLPMPMVNVISGGAHAAGVVDIQDFLVVPVGADRFSEAIEWAATIRKHAADVAAERGYVTALVADEGGLGLPLPSNREALEVLARGIERTGLALGEHAAIALDVAATQLVDGDGYRLCSEDRWLTSEALIDEIDRWCSAFPIVSIEDPLAEDDWPGWKQITDRLGDSLQIVGDDLFVTDVARLQRGIDSRIANGVLIKPNQNGTLSGTNDVLRQAVAAGYATVLSARSGDTEDTWLADFAVGWRTGQIKVGSTTRSERTAKWNRLIQIETELGNEAPFAGSATLGRSR